MSLTIVLNNEKRFFLEIFIVSSLVAVCNILFSNSRDITIIMAVIESLILLLCLVRRRVTDYLIMYAIFFSTALEFESLTTSGVLYSVKTLRIAGLNLGIWMLIPLWLMIIFRPLQIGMVKESTPCFWRFSRNLILMNLIAAVVGLLLIAVNDNNIRNMENYKKAFLGCAYSSMLLPITFFTGFIIVVTNEKKELWKIGVLLQAILCSAVVQIIAASVAGVNGRYGNERTLLIATIYFFVPLLFLIPLIDFRSQFGLLSLLIALVGTVLIIVNNATGKIYLTLIIVIVIVFLKNKNSPNAYIKVLSFIVFIVLMLGVVALTIAVYDTTGMSGAKLRAAVELLSIWRPDWLLNMQYSPRARVAEFLNICIEYAHKPWLFITGKGYMGSIRDHVNMFGDMIRHADSYQVEEWKNGTFFNLHELASNYLMFGLMGIVYSIQLIKTTYKKFVGNPFLLIGTYWFLLLYGYSFTLSVYGIICFFYGLIRVDITE